MEIFIKKHLKDFLFLLVFSNIHEFLVFVFHEFFVDNRKK